ncbi:hypothetical protein DRN52_07235 [Thermococci archaeon]|nr:MAG: hypothetical protein DRN52_07235 [Thermococci archaeon]
MSALKTLLDDLMEQRTFRFEEPWRLSSRALSLAIPIVRTEYGERNYLVLEEISESNGVVDIMDSGEIRRLIVKNRVNKPVFIRGGVMVKGETQPRAVRFSVVVSPGEERQIEALCVHDVRPIRARARMRTTREVPIGLQMILYKGRQDELWEAIRYFRTTPRGRFHDTTDLTEIVEAFEEGDRTIREVIEKFPLIENQVGVAVIDAKGVLAIELFDHPDSWSAVAKGAGRKFAEVLAEESDFEVFKPDREGIMEAIRNFISKLADCEEREVFKSERARTSLLRGKDVYGEYTVLDGSVIHLMAVRRYPRLYPRVIEPYFEPEISEGPSSMGILRMVRWNESSIFNARLRAGTEKTIQTLRRVLEVLEEGGKPWAELESCLSKEMSTATLSKRLKNGLSQGLIVRSLRGNGRIVYELTAKGKALLERAKKKKKDGEESPK